MMPAKLVKGTDEFTLDLSSCRGSEFQLALEKIKEVPGSKYDGQRKLWCIMPEATSVERVLHSIQPDADSSIIEWVKDARRAGDAELVSALPDDYDGLLIPWASQRQPWQPEKIGDEDFTGLKPHQRSVVGAVAKDKSDIRAIIADDMGLGKTASAISIISESGIHREQEIKAYPVLIVCPNSVKGVWKREVERWLGDDEPAVVIDGTTLKARQNQISEAIELRAWTIVNYEQLRTVREKIKTKSGGSKTVEKLKEPFFEKVKWGAVILDEAHRAKNRKAKQTRGIYRIDSPIKLALTGTPIMNSPDDLWSLLHWLYPSEYKSYWRFFETYVDYVEGYFGKDIIGVKNPDQLRFELKDRLYRRTKDQVLNLPEKQRITVPVTLDNKSRKLYNEAERNFWIEVETAVEEGDSSAKELVDAVASGRRRLYAIPNGAARTVRLRQILSNIALLGGENHSNKMEALLDRISDNRHKQHVVFSEFVQSCQILAERITSTLGLTAETYTGETKDKDRRGIEDKFQRGEIDILVGTIGAMREGLTLTAADTVHFLERAWVPGWNTQAEDRLHRIGQSVPVTVLIYEAESTVDDGTIYLTNRLKDRIVKTVLPQDEVKET
jgi:SNF2 family DNA or RNA helicase